MPTWAGWAGHFNNASWTMWGWEEDSLEAQVEVA